MVRSNKIILKKTYFFQKYKKSILLKKNNLNSVGGSKVIRFKKKNSIKVVENFYPSIASIFLICFLDFDIIRKKYIINLIKKSTKIQFLTSSYLFKLFSYSAFNVFFFKNNKIPFFTHLGFVKNFSLVGNIKPSNYLNSIYSNSLGSYSKLVYKNFNFNFSHLRLPSGEVRKFPLDTFVFYKKEMSRFNLKFKYFYKNNKKLKLKKGFRFKVRGVAMNPIDHPHGGNTKSIKFPRTPWGFATKLK